MEGVVAKFMNYVKVDASEYFVFVDEIRPTAEFVENLDSIREYLLSNAVSKEEVRRISNKLQEFMNAIDENEHTFLGDIDILYEDGEISEDEKMNYEENLDQFVIDIKLLQGMVSNVNQDKVVGGRRKVRKTKSRKQKKSKSRKSKKIRKHY